MEIVMKQNRQELVSGVKDILSDVLMKITWREIAHDYFGKSSSWLYHKLDGIDGNGRKGGFSQGELQQLKGGLIDLSDKIRRAAERL